MRHVICMSLAVLTAFWLAPSAHLLPPARRNAETAFIIGFFFALDLAAGLIKAGRQAIAARRGA